MADATPIRPRSQMRRVWKMHKLLWRLSGGRLGREVGGMPCLELVTTGHRSGEARTILIWYLHYPDGYALCGTNAGADRDPAWVQNLRANPAARIRVDGEWLDVRARFLEGAEHEAMWQRFVAANDGYADYAAVLTRPIPIVALEPTQG